LMRGSMPAFDTYARRTVLDVAELSTPWVALQKERDLITVCHLEAKHHARVVSDFLESVKGNPESPPQITWSLLLVGLIFLAGVIYPLTFMPVVMPPTLTFSWIELIDALMSIKGALLSLLAASFSFVFLMFTYTNISMKYAVEKIVKLETLTDAKHYSAYFSHLTQNSS